MSDRSYRILLVDDSAEDLDSYRQYLCQDQECEYTFTEAEVGADGLKLALEQEFDCIILDYQMPDFDGLEFLRRLRDTKGDDHAPVVMVTGQGDERVAVQALRLGASDYFVKAHLTAESIYRATRNAIEKRAQEIELRVQTERSRSLQEQLSLLVEGARDHALILLDAEGRIAKWNKGAEFLTGFSEADVIGKDESLLFREDDARKDLPAQERARASRSGKVEFERWMKRKGGGEFWATGSVSLLSDQPGRGRGFAKIIRDDTLKYRLNDERSNQQKWLESVLNLVPVAFVLLDHRSGRVLFANRSAHQLAGGCFPHCDNVDDYARNFDFRDPSGKPLPLEQMPGVRSVGGTRAEPFEVIWVTPAGRHSLLVDSEVLPPQFGHEPVIILTLQNVSTLKTTQTALETAMVSAEDASSSKSAFLANMSHEIRTPLGAILGFTELIAKESVPNADKAKYAEVVKRNGRVLMQLIDDILDLSKIEAGKLKLERETFELRRFVEDVLDIYSAKASEKGVALRLDIDGDLPEVVETDATRLRQILYNVIGNALKFTERGFVRVSVSRQIPAGNRPCVLFRIEDSGIGIASEHQKMLFSPFMQADSSTKRKFGGTGLGLMLSKRLASALGGQFYLVTSEPQKGSTFELALPIEAQAGGLVASVEEGGSSPTAEPANLAKARILVVDDQDDFRALFAEILTSHGAIVSTANGGREALALFEEVRFDLVIMDVQMPEMDGCQVTQTFRARGFGGPILGLSANVFREDRERSLAAGMNEHLTKPITGRRLLEKVASYLNSRREPKEAKEVSV